MSERYLKACKRVEETFALQWAWRVPKREACSTTRSTYHVSTFSRHSITAKAFLSRKATISVTSLNNPSVGVYGDICLGACTLGSRLRMWGMEMMPLSMNPTYHESCQSFMFKCLQKIWQIGHSWGRDCRTIVQLDMTVLLWVPSQIISSHIIWSSNSRVQLWSSM